MLAKLGTFHDAKPLSGAFGILGQPSLADATPDLQEHEHPEKQSPGE